MTQRVHASAVALGQNGALIKGASGSGKSSLALELVSMGASLIADDAVDLIVDAGQISLRCPEPIKGLLEIRGIGLLNVTTCVQAGLVIIVDLDRLETDRLPPPRSEALLGMQVPVLYGKQNPNLGRAVYCLLSGATLETISE